MCMKKKESKADIYRSYGIEYKSGKIYHEEFGHIPCLLVDGNEKIGKGVFHFSLLPTNNVFDVEINGKLYSVKGTCPCSCNGCYATKGNYRFKSTIESLAVKTWLAYNDIDFVERAIKAQIKSDNIEFIRIHASGDFFNMEYVEMWKRIVSENSNCKFWTYTKFDNAENAFNDLENGNIVKSKIAHHGFNFGHCDYIISVYNYLKSIGAKVFICGCGIEKAVGIDARHCNSCKGCSEYDYVLFIEHSTEYKAVNDPLFNELVKIILAQENFISVTENR